MIVDEFWRSRTEFPRDLSRMPGFIDRERGHSLDSANAMVRAREAGLVESRAPMLRSEDLLYRELVPLMLVRGTI